MNIGNGSIVTLTFLNNKWSYTKMKFIKIIQKIEGFKKSISQKLLEISNMKFIKEVKMGLIILFRTR